jgi:hypothetical protein
MRGMVVSKRPWRLAPASGSRTSRTLGGRQAARMLADTRHRSLKACVANACGCGLPTRRTASGRERGARLARGDAAGDHPCREQSDQPRRVLAVGTRRTVRCGRCLGGVGRTSGSTGARTAELVDSPGGLVRARLPLSFGRFAR